MRRPLLAALVAGLVLAPAPALAAPTLVEVEPGNGAVVAAPPRSVVLTFNEPLAGARVDLVRSPDGTGSRPTRLDGARLAVALRAGQDAAGQYVLGYTVTAVQGGQVSGEVGFTVDPEAGDAEPPASSAWGGPLGLALLAGLGFALWSTLRRWGRAHSDTGDGGR